MVVLEIMRGMLSEKLIAEHKARGLSRAPQRKLTRT